MSANELLLDVEVFPDGGIVVVEDLGTKHGPDHLSAGAGEEVGCDATAQSVHVYTMSADESDTAGKLVRVRVYSGTESEGLGKPVFDGDLELTSGALAVGEILHPPDYKHKLTLDGPGTMHVRIFTVRGIQTIHYTTGDHPASGPSEINVLIRRDST